MTRLLPFLFLLSILSCGQAGWNMNSDDIDSVRYSRFDSSRHLQPLFDKVSFDTLHGWDFCWALLEPINLAGSRDDDERLSRRFSRGQKALYFIWYLDAQVTNGGFPQFYLNRYREYIPAIKNGLKLIGDTAMLDLVVKADNEYLAHQEEIEGYHFKRDWGPLYKKPYKFSEYNKIYHATHDSMIGFIEQYARKHPEEFVKFK